jgi:uncharacterized protein (TIGR00303 family)
MTKEAKLFVLVISGTDTISHPGISAAGANFEALKYTSALDAEFVALGQTLSKSNLAVSPKGIVSPALISKACLNILGWDCQIFNLGAHIAPQIKCHHVHLVPGASICSGNTIDIKIVEKIFSDGKVAGEELKQKYKQLIIAECVVGGTTSALGLLTALGYQCNGMISSSFPKGNHQIKDKLINEGLKKLKARNPFYQKTIEDNPLEAIAAMGDPSQAFIAGLAIAHPECILAGGTQMLAIKTLIDKFDHSETSLITSEWVYNDSSAKFQKLHKLVCPKTQVAYSQISHNEIYTKLDNEIKQISEERFDLGLIIDKYNQGHVKEGVGMGALLYSLGFNGSY